MVKGLLANLARDLEKELAKFRAALESGCDPNEANEDGGRALCIAAGWGNLELVTLLVDHGADVNLSDSSGTPLYHVARWMSPALGEEARADAHAVLLLLLERGADPAQPVTTRSSVFNVKLSAGPDGLADLLDQFKSLASGKGEARSMTAMDAAASARNPITLRLLRDHGGILTLHGAIVLDERDSVERLLAAGCSVDTLDSGGACALACAVDCGRTEVVRLLLERGADPNGPADSGLSVIEYAAWLGPTASGGSLELLRSHGARLSLCALVALGMTDEVRRMLDAGESAIEPTDGFYNHTPLHFAATWNRVEVASLLIERGADINDNNMSWATPLDCAVSESAHDVARDLLLVTGVAPASEFLEDMRTL